MCAVATANAHPAVQFGPFFLTLGNAAATGATVLRPAVTRRVGAARPTGRAATARMVGGGEVGAERGGWGEVEKRV